MLRLPKARATNSWFKAQSYRALDKFIVYGVFKRLGDPVTPMSDETEAAIPAIRIWGSYFVAATSAFLVSSSLGLGKSRSLPAQPGSITPSQSSEQEPSGLDETKQHHTNGEYATPRSFTILLCICHTHGRIFILMRRPAAQVDQIIFTPFLTSRARLVTPDLWSSTMFVSLIQSSMHFFKRRTARHGVANPTIWTA
ncbi:hypothetical protein QC763_117475 [Podospora pseudopauciseta]|uniref:Uncharacterized protein n=1 Tax=Podospora pseudopauciseta TaxID=2093780 RepID=A0ABR0I1S4_9PEZI|nr:hypothetical protein QC763_117475 [Podospora pseudopauciseta]